MEEKFTWIPFYMELSKALLIYKDNRKPLVDFIYSDLSKVGEKSLVDYLHMKDGSKISDIDPFSVFAIFNRNVRWNNRTAFLQKFKDHFSLSQEVPTDFDGIPTVDSRRAFFFSWGVDNAKIIHDLWDLFENVVLEKDFSKNFNQVLDNNMPKNSLTMTLFWISPYKFLALDQRNRSYLQIYGYNAEITNFNYATYQELIQNVNDMMTHGIMACKNFPELSNEAWKISQTGRIWMFSGNEQTFQSDMLKIGSSARGRLKFEEFKSKKALGDAYRKIVENSDVSIPQMYWQFIHEVKVGDIIVVFDTKKKPSPQHHLLYGWGQIISDVSYDYEDENPISRKVVWNSPQPAAPIKETKTKNALFFHDVSGTDAANIKRLLNIDNSTPKVMEVKAKVQYDKYIELLKVNKNLILTGAPGTGKTFMAKAIAEEMGAECEFVQFHPSYDYTDFVEGLRPIQRIAGEVGFERRNGVFKDFCARAIQNLLDSKKTIQTLQTESSVRDLLESFIETSMESGTMFETSGTKNAFYIIDNKEKSIIVKIPANEKTSEIALPKSDLTTLLENKVPIDGGGDIQSYFKRKYRTQPDSYVYVLYNILRKKSTPLANTASVALIPEKKFVFVIDEINRGEISKIFGELFFSIDPGYRGVAGRVKTQYQNLIEEGDAFKDGFYVPENVYIIGTMNDIDRSVESMDFAMRRRFAWAEVTAEESMKMLDGIANEGEIKRKMQNLNDAILKVRGLGAAYQIGAAYFKKIEEYGGDFQKLWDFHLKGLLFEYLRGNVNAEEQLEELKQAYDK